MGANGRLEMINVCAGVRWGGFLTKPLTYLEYARGIMQKTRTSNIKEEDVSIMFVDSDTFWASHSVDTIFNKYDCIRKGKSLVMSSEISCWVGRYCTADDIELFYKNSISPSYSSFINSGLVMGSPSALVHMFKEIVRKNASSFVMKGSGTMKFDDQYAFVAYYADYPSRVAIDHHQELFGSISIVVDLNRTKFPFVCESQNNLARSFHMSCDDVTISKVVSGLVYYISKDQHCELRRETDPDPKLLKGHSAEKKLRETLRTLAKDPVIWHGSGSGKRVMLSMDTKVIECINQQGN
jgi:hypothetical protein